MARRDRTPTTESIDPHVGTSGPSKPAIRSPRYGGPWKICANNYCCQPIETLMAVSSLCMLGLPIPRPARNFSPNVPCDVRDEAPFDLAAGRHIRHNCACGAKLATRWQPVTAPLIRNLRRHHAPARPFSRSGYYGGQCRYLKRRCGLFGPACAQRGQVEGAARGRHGRRNLCCANGELPGW